MQVERKYRFIWKIEEGVLNGSGLMYLVYLIEEFLTERNSLNSKRSFNVFGRNSSMDL